MPDDAYRDEVYKHALTVLEQTARLLRTDADIVELIHKMVATAEEEVKRRPALLFESGGLGAGEGDIVGGQTVAEKLLTKLFEHMEKEKELIKPYIGEILKLIAKAVGA